VLRSDTAIINLIVTDQLGSEVPFKVTAHTRLEKLFRAYCHKKSIDPHAYSFLFNGQRVCGDYTPKDLGMQENEEIVCYAKQVGC
jgi:small ubiquitin-related modifier